MTGTAPTQTPKTPAEFEAVLKDQSAINQLFKDGKFGDFVADYAQAHAIANLDIQERVEAEVQRGLAAFIKDNGAKMRRPDQTPTNGVVKGVSTGRGAVYNKAAPGAAIDRSDHAPEDMAEFLRATWHHASNLDNGDELRAKAGEWRKIQNSFGSTVPADGGFLIPEDLRSELLSIALENTVVRQRATVIPMSSLAVPIPMVDDTSHASSVFGGIVAYWTDRRCFTQDDIAFMAIFARHAAVALTASWNEAGLHTALDTRKLIGQAQGRRPRRRSSGEARDVAHRSTMTSGDRSEMRSHSLNALTDS